MVVFVVERAGLVQVFFPSTSVFLCQYHYSNAAYSFFLLWPKRTSIAIYDVVMYVLKASRDFSVCGGKYGQSRLKLGDVRPFKHFFLWRWNPTRVMASSFLRFLDHTQRRITVGRTPLDEWSARRRDLYLTTHNTHNRQTSMPPVGFESMISAGQRP